MSKQKPIDKAIDALQKIYDEAGDPENDHVMADNVLIKFILETEPVKGPKLVTLFNDLIKWYA